MTATINASTSSGVVTTADNSGVLQLQTASTAALTIDGSQNVGIGTASPSKKLQVNSTDGTISVFKTTSGANNSVLNIDISDATATAGFSVGGNSTFPALTFANGGSERMRIDSSGNVGIGTTSPSYKLQVAGSIKEVQSSEAATVGNVQSTFAASFQRTSTDTVFNVGYATTPDAWMLSATYGTTGAYKPIAFATSDTERMRITSSGDLCVGKTTTDNATVGASWSSTGAGTSVYVGGAGDGPQIQVVNTTASGTVPNGFRYLSFRLGATATEIGTITKASATTVAYNTSSDYRLKYNIAPMTGALEKVKQLKPCTYKWHEDDSDGEGFIAHELAEVCPFAVTGEKDAVNEDGSIKPQGIDTSFLVATLTAAIQEQQALIQTLTDRITALEGK